MKNRHLHHRVLRNRGAAVITAVLFFVIIATVIVVSLSSSVVRDFSASRDFEKSKEAYYLSEAGLEDVVYRIKKSITVGSPVTLLLNNSQATTVTTATGVTTKSIVSTGSVTTNTRRVNASLSSGAGESFNYAMLVGPWGLFMGANAQINGNVYSGGPICAGGINPGDWGTLYGNCMTTPNNPFWPPYSTSVITGTVVSTGTTGSNGWIARVTNQGGNSMYAGGIANSIVSGSAYCNTTYATSPGTCETLPSQSLATFALSNADITAFETIATAGGVDPCNSWDNKVITTDSTIGPRKYGCQSLTFAGPYVGTPLTITLQGPIWSTGFIQFTGKVNVRVDPAYAGQSMPIIADKAGDNWFSRILLNDGFQKTFTGATGGNSWVTLISTNNAVQGGDYSNPAIDVGTNASGDVILYAKDGLIRLDTSSVAEIDGYGVQLKNNAVVNYVMGLSNTLFYMGPGGSWTAKDWKLGQ